MDLREHQRKNRAKQEVRLTKDPDQNNKFGGTTQGADSQEEVNQV